MNRLIPYEEVLADMRSRIQNMPVTLVEHPVRTLFPRVVMPECEHHIPFDSVCLQCGDPALPKPFIKGKMTIPSWSLLTAPLRRIKEAYP